MGIAHTLDKRHTDITYKLAHGLNIWSEFNDILSGNTNTNSRGYGANSYAVKMHVRQAQKCNTLRCSVNFVQSSTSKAVQKRQLVASAYNA